VRCSNSRNLFAVEIEVDGGVDPSNASMIAQAGATILVSGSGIFNNNASVSENIAAFRAGLDQMG